jgi:hypothetical protein
MRAAWSMSSRWIHFTSRWNTLVSILTLPHLHGQEDGSVNHLHGKEDGEQTCLRGLRDDRLDHPHSYSTCTSC